MRSESTSALGQPSETKPTLGAGVLEATAFAVMGQRCRRRGAVPQPLVLAAVMPALSRLLGVVRRVFAAGAAGKLREREAAEQVARLLLQLLLHVHERARALLEVAAHQALHRRALHLHELAPRFGVEHRVVAVELRATGPAAASGSR